MSEPWYDDEYPKVEVEMFTADCIDVYVDGEYVETLMMVDDEDDEEEDDSEWY